MLESHVVSEELRSLLGGLLRTRHVARVLQSCEAHEESSDVLARMREGGLTVLAVSQAGEIVGTVHRDRLQPGMCGPQADRLSKEQLIEGDEPLLKLLRRLRRRHWLLVTVERRIRGFVSRSDLQRAPVRMLLFGFVSLFEMLLLELVQRNYSDQQIAQALTPNRLRLAQRLHDDRENRGEELALSDCLQIADKRDLLLAADGCSVQLGFDSNKTASRFFYQVEELRDRLVHANDLIAGSNWEEVIDITIQLADFLSRNAKS